MAKVSLHLGAHKTASTHFERMLRHNVNALQFTGIRVPLKRDVRKAITGNLGQVKPGMPIADQLSKGIDQLLKNRSRIVVCDENLLGTTRNVLAKGNFYPYAERRISRVVRLLQGHELQIFVAIRNPADFLVSCYCETVRTFGYVPFAEFAQGTFASKARWAGLLRRIARVAPGVPITVWQYEGYKKVWRAVSQRALGLDTQQSERLEWLDEVVRPGLSCRVLDHLKHHAECGHSPLLRAQVNELISLHPRTLLNPAPNPLTVRDRLWLARSFAADLVSIRNLPGVEFLGPQRMAGIWRNPIRIHNW